MGVITIIDGILQLRIVQWVLLAATILLIALTVYLEVRVRTLAGELKSTKADLVWVQGALSLQNNAIKKAGEDMEALKKQVTTKAQEAAKAKGQAQTTAVEIMHLKLGKTCEEVRVWGIQQGIKQGAW